MVLDKPFSEISKEDIESLIENEVTEGKRIEYKETLPGNTDSDKKEFLADVSSFANASRGIIIYGIEEKRDENGRPTGIPDEVVGINVSNKDAEQLRLENIIRDGIEPRISRVGFQYIGDFPNGDILLIHIPKSWISPHMISFKGSNRFYSRTSSGKHLLDVTEIRSAFISTQLYPDRIRSFRNERISQILAGETPVPLLPNPIVVMHLVPVSSVEEQKRIDIIGKLDAGSPLPPIYTSGYSQRYNFDGILTYSMVTDSDKCYSYLQVFHDGSLEAVTSGLIREWQGKKVIASVTYESELLKALKHFLEIYQKLGMDTPIYLMLTLIDVRGYYLGVNELKFWGLRELHTIEKEVLQIPEIVINDYDKYPGSILKPAFDSIWQACGFSHSYNYDEKGQWVGH